MGDLSVNDEADGDGEGGRRRTDPYYLRLTMGRPVGRPMSRSTPTMAYGLQVGSELLERLLFIFQLKITHLLVKVDHQQEKVEEKNIIVSKMLCSSLKLILKKILFFYIYFDKFFVSDSSELKFVS